MSGNAAARKPLRSFAWAANFDNRFSGSQQGKRLIENRGENRFKTCVCCIAARDPQQLRWWPIALDEIYEVAVFANQYGTALLRSLENLEILRVSEPQIAQGEGHYAEVFS